ncbi:MAG TPA: gamma-glutamyltransferase [Hyphomicrobiales bacterium]|nr:gamma-glutamyltransferase [Hyphomicrobiales bacterium]
MTAEAAAEVLREGGNAFDAAIAGLWMACIAEPVLASPGGGGFVMARSADLSRTRLFDFFVHTPKRKPDPAELEFEGVHADFGTATQEFHVGAGASAVPGFVPGLFALNEALASLPMTRLAEPAVSAARAGITVNATQARIFQIVGPILTWSAEARALFAPEGELLEEGAPWRNGALGEVIDVIAREGPRIASEGEIARAMLAVTDNGGALTADDLTSYAVAEREPLAAELDGVALFLNPPPSCGGGLIRDMLTRLAGQGRPLSITPVKLARAIDETDRAWRAADCDIERFLGLPTAMGAATRSRGTTHISVIDAAGNAAAVTVSNGEGNGRMVPGCGFMINNMLGEEDINPHGFHAWPEDARLSSMMAPSVLVSRDGAVTALGSGGSNRIRTALFQVSARLLAGSGDLEALVMGPRIHVERGHVDFEDFFDPDEREALTGAFADHRAWPERSLYFGGVHVARREAAGGVAAAGDPRRGGVALLV